VDLILLARRPVEAVESLLHRPWRLRGDQQLVKLPLDKRRRMAIEHRQERVELCEIGLRQLDTAGQRHRQDTQREEDFRRQQYPLQQLAIRQGAVSASPFNQTTTGTVTGRPSYWDMASRAAGAFFPTGSDEDMKRNIGGIKNPLDKVRRLKGIEFEWENGYGENEGEDKGGEEDMGMSAQSVERAMPEAVSRRESDNMRQYDLPQVVGLLTEAVKELDKKVDGKRRGRA
jgi:hypothetical protein